MVYLYDQSSCHAFRYVIFRIIHNFNFAGGIENDIYINSNAAAWRGIIYIGILSSGFSAIDRSIGKLDSDVLNLQNIL